MAKTRGFDNNAKKIAAKENVSVKSADKILASATRKASPAAKAKNPFFWSEERIMKYRRKSQTFSSNFSQIFRTQSNKTA